MRQNHPGFLDLSEGILGLGSVKNPGLYHRLRPIRMVQGVWGELGLNGDAAPATIGDSVLALGFANKIAGIYLNTGTIGADFHFSAGGYVAKGEAGVAAYQIIVIVAVLQAQTFIICGNVLR